MGKPMTRSDVLDKVWALINATRGAPLSVASQALAEVAEAIDTYAAEQVARVCAEQMEAYAEGRVKAERAKCSMICEIAACKEETDRALYCRDLIRARAQEE